MQNQYEKIEEMSRLQHRIQGLESRNNPKHLKQQVSKFLLKHLKPPPCYVSDEEEPNITPKSKRCHCYTGITSLNMDIIKLSEITLVPPIDRLRPIFCLWI